MRRVLSVTCIALLVLILGNGALIAGNSSRVGTAGAQELLIPVGARGIALSGSLVASATGVDALYWNPAGLARSANGTEAMFSSMRTIGDIGISYAAIGLKAGSLGSLGLSLKTLDFGDIPVTTEDFPDGNGQHFSPSFITVGLAYSNLVSDRVSVGFALNIVTEKIMSTSASGFSANVGIQYADLVIPGLNLGVTIKNVGPDMTFSGADLYRQATLKDNPLRPVDYYTINSATIELPTYLELGLSYSAKVKDISSVMVSGNFQSNNYSNDMFLVGAEYGFKDMFFVRGGYAFALNEVADVTGQLPNIFKYTLGAGVKLDVGGTLLSVDYAYRAQQNFDGSNVLTIAVGF
jgi:hypothetical protein